MPVDPVLLNTFLKIDFERDIRRVEGVYDIAQGEAEAIGITNNLDRVYMFGTFAKGNWTDVEGGVDPDVQDIYDVFSNEETLPAETSILLFTDPVIAPMAYSAGGFQIKVNDIDFYEYDLMFLIWAADLNDFG